MTTKQNIIMDSDSYKYSHPDQYPTNMVEMYDYAEARIKDDFTIFFGLQYIIKNTLCTPITVEDVQEAAEYAEFHGIPFETDGWMYIATELKGKLPVKIKAAPEGSKIPTKMVLFTVQSTDKKVPWVASWLETSLMRVWYTSNIATYSYKVKEMLMSYAEATQENPFVDYQFHNFGSRGSSSAESAMIGGMAHITQFSGTDNFSAIKAASEFYNVPKEQRGTIAHSIPASEHSAVTSWSKEGEFKMVNHFLDKNKGRAIMACVADSYDFFNFVDVVTSDEEIVGKIESDEYPTFVIRPDSGNPEEIIPKMLDIMEKNEVLFTVNSKGYRVFNKYRIIWGDGIEMKSMKTMLDILVTRGYSSENIAFGMGGGLMQGNGEVSNNRDTQAWAIKCSSITLSDGSEIDVFKDPITAPDKKSKKGKVTTYYNPATKIYFVDKINIDFDNGSRDILETVYENGEMKKEYSFDEVRNNSKAK